MANVSPLGFSVRISASVYRPIKNAPQDGVFRINRKDFSPRVSVAWEPRFKFFNVFNKVNFDNPTLDLRSPATFGVITTQLIAAGLRPRVIQIGARIEF